VLDISTSEENLAATQLTANYFEHVKVPL